MHWTGETVRALLTYSADWDKQSEHPVFFSQGGNLSGLALTRSGVKQILLKIGAAANVKRCTPHAFRHTYATMFIAGGGQQMALMDLMGHSDLLQTRE